MLDQYSNAIADDDATNDDALRHVATEKRRKVARRFRSLCSLPHAVLTATHCADLCVPHAVLSLLPITVLTADHCAELCVLQIQLALEHATRRRNKNRQTEGQVSGQRRGYVGRGEVVRERAEAKVRGQR